MLAGLALALSARTAAVQDAPPGNGGEQGVALELRSEDPVLPGRGPFRALEHACEREGTLFVWARSGDLDPFLRVSERGGRRVVEDDDSGGGTTAFISLSVEPGWELRVEVAAATEGAAGSVELHLFSLPESEETRAAAATGRVELEQLGLGRAMSGLEQVRGTSPMFLCGLALTGANLPEGDLGQVSGLVTAEQIATWDLRGCELAVLSACDTHVGVRRAGQGVASLQSALHIAGARSVITSLWKVPDEATRELMLDFYRRLWVAGKPKRQALWEAKLRLRDARDPEGRPRHTTRDWAAWVLTGDPR